MTSSLMSLRFHDNEHSYFESISDGREFQFFGAHFVLEIRVNINEFHRYTLRTHETIIE